MRNVPRPWDDPYDVILRRRLAERHRRPCPAARPADAARLTVEVDAGGVVRCSGQLHQEDAGAFHGAVASADLRPLRLDLGALTSADATGVQLLVSLRRDERRRGRTVELLHVPASIAQVLCIAELADEFDADHSGQRERSSVSR